MRRLIALGLIFLFGQASICLAEPDRTMSVAPTAVSGETISSSDENSRNNEISSKFNAHTHNDITVVNTGNTFTIGDGAVGNKTYAVNTDQSSDPGLRYNTSTDQWTLSQDGSSYLAVAHAGTTDGLASGAMLYAVGGTVSAGIVSAGNATNGQLLIGRTGGAPTLGNITGSNGVTVTNSPGTVNVAGIVSATPSLTLSTSNSAGSASTYVATDATVAAFDATVPTTMTYGASAATGSAGVAARRDHAHGGVTSPAWQWVESLATTSGTQVTSATLPTDSDLFMIVFENVRGAVGQPLNFTGVDNNVSIHGTTNTTAASATIAEFGNGTASAVNGVIYVPRLTDADSTIMITGTLVYEDSSAADSIFLYAIETSGSNFTTFDFTTGGGGYTAGKIHIYKSIPS